MIKKKSVSKVLLLITLTFGLMSSSVASVIVKGQVVKVSILGVPDKDKGNISANYNVNASGTIRLWQIGNVKAAGLTSEELAQKIEHAYRAQQIFSSPAVQVTSNSGEDMLKHTVTVGGDVRNKGIIPHVRDMTLFQAVTAAGGATEFGAVNRVELIRNRKLYIFNLKKDDHKLLRIYPNDTVIVPRKDWKGQ